MEVIKQSRFVALRA